MDIKLLVLDIDGTIAGKSNQVSEPVKQAIAAAQAKGIQVALATGRMYSSALRFHAAVASQLPIVAYNGAWIQNPGNQKRERHLPVSTQKALELLDYFEQPEWRSSIEVHFYIDDRLYVRQITPYTESYAQRSGSEPIAVGDLRNILNSELTKVLTISSDTQAIEKISQSLRKRYPPEELYLTQSTEYYFEATNPEANKGLAVRYLTEKILGLEANNVMAIGDNFNDLEMLQYAGTSVAMSNGPKAVQKAAQWVAPDVEEEGVAIAIEKFIL